MLPKSMSPTSSFGHRRSAAAVEAQAGLKETLKQEIDRLMPAGNNGGTGVDIMQQTLRQEVDRMMSAMRHGDMPMPLGLNLRNTLTGVEIEAALPDFNEEELRVTIAGDQLTIQAEHKSNNDRDESGRPMAERFASSMSESVKLPFAATDADIRTGFHDGVLRVAVTRS